MDNLTAQKIAMLEQHNASMELDKFGHEQNRLFNQSIGAPTDEADAAIAIIEARIAFNNSQLEALRES